MGILDTKAAVACTVAHESIQQMRKYGDRRYYTHPLTVAALVHTLPGTDEAMFAAACLHDVIEDVYPKNPAYGPAWVANNFGEEVLLLVHELTTEFTKERYPDLNRNERKRRESLRLADISDAAKVVKQADLYHNSTEISPDTRFWGQWLKEKNELDELIGAWEDRECGFLTGGDVWSLVGSGEFKMLVATAHEIDEFYKVADWGLVTA
jgi:(p)ppGpp synthase/HD superfamily hydrolase